MSYATITIGDLLADVNSRYFLPAIQRPFVWSSDQVITLIDSLLKGYPISSLMFWAVDEDLKRELRIYNFIENWKPGIQNLPASVNGRDVTLVLDGQQRITSLLIALRGSFAEKAKHKRSSSVDAWSEKTLYIDLLTDPASEIEDEDVEHGVSYGLRFHAVAPRNDHRHQWFRVGDILNHRTPEKLETLIEATLARVHHGATPYERDLISTTLRRLHEVIWADAVINYYTETSASVDRVLDIFVRANDGGTKLSKSDLLMSLITSKWENGSAREAVFDFVDYINKELPQPNKISKDFILKCCLVLCGFDVKYNVSNFTQHSIAEIERNWPDIREALERTFLYLNGLALSERAARGEFLSWRDRMAKTSRRQADYTYSVLALIIAWAYDRGLVPSNLCERPGKVYRSERIDSIWTSEDEAAFLKVAPSHIGLAFMLALWTGQRQGDLLRLPWSAYDGQRIRLRQRKTGARVEIPVGKPLRATLDQTSRRAVTIMATSRNTSWTESGFRASWGKACKKAGVEDVTFHDLRGTAVTRLAVAGCSVPEIAAITGHSLKQVTAILDAHYLSRD